MHLIQLPCTPNEQGICPLDTLWDQVAPHLDSAISHSGGMTTLEIEREMLRTGQKQLWVIIVGKGAEAKITAAGVTSLERYPGGLFVANIQCFGGADMKTWFSLKDQFEDWAKSEGCSKVRFYARRGWPKWLPDYEIKQYVMEKAL